MVNASVRFGRTARVCDFAHPAFRPFGGGYILESRAIPRRMDVSATREGELSQLAVRACLVALAATLGGCSTSEVTVQNWTPATVGGSSDATDLSRPDYRRIVADNINKIFPNSA